METIKTEPKKVAIYARCSTKTQDLDLQLEDCRKYSQDRGWSVVDEYRDAGFSGSLKSRPQLDRLMADAREKLFDVVLIWKYDRFARSAIHLATALDEFRSLNVDFVSLREAVDTTSAMGRFVFTLFAGIAEFEKNLIQERVQCGVTRAIQKRGKWGRAKIAVSLDCIEEMLSKGYSVRKMAMSLGIARGTIHNRLQELSRIPQCQTVAV